MKNLTIIEWIIIAAIVGILIAIACNPHKGAPNSDVIELVVIKQVHAGEDDDGHKVDMTNGNEYYWDHDWAIVEDVNTGERFKPAGYYGRAGEVFKMSREYIIKRHTEK